MWPWWAHERALSLPDIVDFGFSGMARLVEWLHRRYVRRRAESIVKGMPFGSGARTLRQVCLPTGSGNDRHGAVCYPRTIGSRARPRRHRAGRHRAGACLMPRSVGDFGGKVLTCGYRESAYCWRPCSKSRVSGSVE